MLCVYSPNCTDFSGNGLGTISPSSALVKVFVHRQKHKDVRRCEQCKKVLPKDARKTQRFCSHKCRNDWWNSHQGELQSKRLTAFVCAVCGKGFTSYKNAKYCSRACFYTSRRS